MFTIGRLFAGTGRVLRLLGGLSCAAGVIFLVVCPPSVASALGGWFLSVGAASWVFGQIPGYIGARLLDAMPSRHLSAYRADDLDFEQRALYSTINSEDQSGLFGGKCHGDDRSGIFGGDWHNDALTWQAMRNGQERGF